VIETGSIFVVYEWAANRVKLWEFTPRVHPCWLAGISM